MSRRATAGPGPGPLRLHGGAVAVMQRLFDAFWIFCAHYVSYLLYPSITRGLASLGVVSPAQSYVAQEWTTQDTLASVTAIVTFQVVAEAHGLYRSWQGVPIRREVFSTLVAWTFSIPVLLFLGFVTKTSEGYSRSVALVWFFGTAVTLTLWRLAMRARLY